MGNLRYNQLSRLRINGYKSIQKCDIELKKINVFIGSNGSGKSNLISVFNFLQAIIRKKLALYVNTNGEANSFLFDGRKVTQQIEMEFYFGQNAYSFILVPTNDNRLIFEKEHFNYYGDYTKQVNINSGHSESLWEQGVGGYIDKYVQPILKKLQWRVYHFHDTSKEALVKQAHNIYNNLELNFNAGNLAAFLYRLLENFGDSYNEIVSTIKLIAPYFDDFVLVPDDNGETIKLRWKQIGCDDVFSASQFSDGTLRFICLATLFLQPSEMQPATIVVDEPELGLHPASITILAEIVKKISAAKQIILSTQSVELLNEFDVNDIVVVDRDDKGSVFKRLDEKGLELWLEQDYSIGELWNKNILGGRLSK